MGQDVRLLSGYSAGDAARLLGVTRGTLHTWSRLLAYPPSRTAGDGAQRFSYEALAALRDALQTGHSVTAAVDVARATLATGSLERLHMAVVTFNADACRATLDDAVGFLGLERAIEEVLVGALERVARTYGQESKHWSFAADRMTCWLREASPRSPAPASGGPIVVVDLSADRRDPDAAYIRALEALCAAAGVTVRTVPVTSLTDRMATAALTRAAVVMIAGRGHGHELTAQWMTAAPPRATVALYRRGDAPAPMVGVSVLELPPHPATARARLLGHTISEQARRRRS
ncbi:MAG TPA: MerR family transcriptional regulator [Solirubrobacteraceae bacterium]|nr:MerR family transcriptional regulator [Solirubrobacteraceae bacterium]